MRPADVLFTAFLPIITRYQLSPLIDKMFIFSNCKAFCCVHVPFRSERVLKSELDLEGTGYQVMPMSFLPCDNW